jgi:hypothetical protein
MWGVRAHPIPPREGLFAIPWHRLANVVLSKGPVAHAKKADAVIVTWKRVTVPREAVAGGA